MTFSTENPDGGYNNPPSENTFGKKRSGELGLILPVISYLRYVKKEVDG